MYENYIIDGNAVYEIDTGCMARQKLSEDRRLMDGNRDDDSIDDSVEDTAFGEHDIRID